MQDPISAGRCSALRAVVLQVIVAVLVSAAFLLQGSQEALAAAGGGLALVAGNALVTMVALGGGVQQAGGALARLMVASMGKWFVVLVVLVMVLGVWRLPPVPALVGLITGLLVHPLALYFDSNRTRFKGSS